MSQPLNQAMSQRMEAKHWAVMLLTAMLFGSSFLFVKMAVESIPPVTLAAGRAVLALPLAWLFLRVSGGRLPSLGRGWAPFLVLGVLTAVIPYIAIAWGQSHIESGLGGILFGTIPVITVLLAPLAIREETYTTSRLAGAAVGLAGVVLVIGPEALAGLGTYVLGAVVTFLAALSYALGGIYARTRVEISPAVMTAGQLATGSAVLVALSLALDAPWALTPPVEALAAVAWVAVFSTALPVLFLFWLIRNVGATNASLMTFFMPVVAVALGAAVLGETLAWPAFAGLALILVGAGGVNGLIRLPRRAVS